MPRREYTPRNDGKKMSFYGLDFGTTNSSISIMKNGESVLIPVDKASQKPEVVRSALYFYPRELKVSNKINKQQLTTNTFSHNQIWYEGEEKTLFGTEAVNRYLKDNHGRHKGIKRKIYTGEIKTLILYTDQSGKTHTVDVPDYYEEIDFGTGRLFHALKTALKSNTFKGNRVFGKWYDLEEMIGMFIAELKKVADGLEEGSKTVVCGRPVQFSPNAEADKAAQDRLEKAVKAAGFDNVTFEYEPVAAAKYYLSRFPSKGKKILVFDFGGGTFDTTIMESTDIDSGSESGMTKGGVRSLDSARDDDNGGKFKILATDGVYIGGDLLNSDIFYHKLGRFFGSTVTFGEAGMSLPSHITAGLRSWFGIPNLNNPDDIDFLTTKVRYKCSDQGAIDNLLHLIQKNLGFEMYEAIEKAKIALTKNKSAKIVFKDDPIDIEVEITREEFEEIIRPRVVAVRETVERTIEKAGLTNKDIEVIVRTGGSSLISVFENMLITMFGEEKVVEFDPFTSVAAGLALG